MAYDLERCLWFKGTPADAAERSLSDLPAARPSLLDDELMLPAAVLKQSALKSNARWMSAFLARAGIDIAPHGKTTMSPELITRQVRDGAWAVTAATAQHVRLYAEFGARRILMANQLVGAANIRAVLDLLRARPALDFLCLVDGPDGVETLASAVAASGLGRPLRVLVELGSPGARAGARTVDDALAVARACAERAPLIELSGVECFEGVHADLASVSELLGRMVEATRRIASEGLFASGEVVVSAGGSAFFDEAAKSLLAAAAAGRPLRLVLRSGCYLTHDSLHYERMLDAIIARSPELAGQGRLIPALEVWAHVQSRPEPGRAVASLGRRDVSHDMDLPTPLWVFRPGRDGAPAAPPAGLSVAKLYDQHACLDVPEGADLRVGDMLAFGVSHPCTTFDKWRALFVVDDEYRVVDIVRTYF